MKTLKVILLVLLAGLLTPLLQAQTTESFTFTTNRVVPDGNYSGLSDIQSVTSTIGSINSVKVRLKVAGEFNGDLYAYLRHSSGFTVLLNRPGKTVSNPLGYGDSGFDITLDDASPNDLHLYQAVTTPPDGFPLTGTWLPDGRNVDPDVVTDADPQTTSLKNFAGMAASGQWTLYLVDAQTGGTNMLTEWGLDISGSANSSITWANPADIVYGTALSAAQLNASVVFDSTNVPGTFAYSPDVGTVLNAGAGQTLSVTFTPTDTATFLPLTKQVIINVQKAPLTITALDTNKLYGAALPTFSASYSGFTNGDTTANLTTPVTLGTTATAASPVASYLITASGATASNYTIVQVNGHLAINPALLTITAVDTNKLYGADLPTFSASYSGFVNGDSASSLTTPVALATTATAASPVGSYLITATGATDPNYTITQVDGHLAVTPVPLTITALDTNKVYGAALPTFSASYSGFVNGDTAASLTTPVTLATSATAASPVGSYLITATGATDPNYTITLANGHLSVTAASITVTAGNATKAFGQALPAFTASYSGFVPGEDTNSLTSLATVSTTATATSDVGTYPISAIGAASPNYTFTYVDGTLTITQALSSGVVVSSANPALPGASVTFTATLSAVAPGAGAPAGTVNFRIDGSIIGSGNLVGGVASFSTSNLAHGSHTVTAEYAGSLNFVGTTNSLAQSQVINTPPVANDDTIQRNPTQSVKVRLSTLLANDTDADGDTLTPTVSTLSANGGSVVVSGGWVIYTPATGFTAADSFTYTISDGHGGSATATVTVAIQTDNQASANLAITALGGNSYRVDGSGIPGRTYRLQYWTGGSNWQDLTSVTADSIGEFSYTDNSTETLRLYRTVTP
jgi:subtilisin-like proprotein convertase family protein